MEDAQARVQKAVTSMFQDLDKDVIRKMQADMYLCSAKCCENMSARVEDVQGCIDRCSEKLNKTQTFVQNELQMYQDRLQRCAMDCQDKARDGVGSNTTENEITKFRGEMEKCVVKCADTHINLLPAMYKRMKEIVIKGQ
ncbi:hypothetical protein ScPMuIL_001763 [Solemya velum]